MLLAAALVALAARPAAACGYSADVSEETTFDPHVLADEPEDLFYDPDRLGFGAACDDCFAREMRADWGSFLGPAVTAADFEQVLLKASLPEIDGLIFTLQGKQKEPPKAFATSSLLSPAADREKLVSALFYVGFARRVEPYALQYSGWSDDEKPKAKLPDPAKLLAGGEAAFAKAKTPFLKQRYAYQLLRLRFYAPDDAGLVKFFEANGAAIEGPSLSLRWRAHHYLAGSLLHSGKTARGNLELARIFASFPPLAPAAANDFAPKDDADWREALALAKTTAEKVQLWRLVGMRNDGAAAMHEMAALDPANPLMALLAVREVNREEAEQADSTKAFPLGALEQTCAQLAAAPKTDRPWLFSLVAAHLAALRGDLPSVRARVAAARRGNPADAAMEAQAKATLGIALASAWANDRSLGTELAQVAGALAKEGRQATALARIAAILGRSGDPMMAALFTELHESNPWTPEKVRSVLAYVQHAKTPFELWAVQASGATAEALAYELASALIAQGKYAEASAALEETLQQTAQTPMGTDPFVMHVIDCHDCDHDTYANGPWTYRKFVARLAELAKTSSGTGEAAAQAALELGSALYNLSPAGNARAWAGEHSSMADFTVAEAAYERTLALSKDRELKAKAAYLGAKCELERRARAGETASADGLPVPAKWFAILAGYKDTAYHREILRECGHYRRWYPRRG